LNWWAGLNIDLSGHYFFARWSCRRTDNDHEHPGVFAARRPSIHIYPKQVLHRVRAWVDRRNLDPQLDASGFDTTSFRDAGFSTALGPGLDVNINEDLAWRVIQADFSFFRILASLRTDFA